MSKISLSIYVLFFMLISSCAPFIIKKNISILKELEKKQYYLRKEVKIAEHHLKKGEKVFIRIKDGKDYIKVYAFSTKKDPLKAKLVLILYIFEEEFKKKKFDLNYFKKRFFEIVNEKK